MQITFGQIATAAMAGVAQNLVHEGTAPEAAPSRRVRADITARIGNERTASDAAEADARIGRGARPRHPAMLRACDAARCDRAAGARVSERIFLRRARPGIIRIAGRRLRDIAHMAHAMMPGRAVVMVVMNGPIGRMMVVMSWPGERSIATGQQDDHAGSNHRTTNYKLHQIILLVGLIERLSRLFCTPLQRQSRASACHVVETAKAISCRACPIRPRTLPQFYGEFV